MRCAKAAGALKMSDYPSLIGRRALVTGGSRGLGRAMAIGLLQAGARVAIVSTGPSRPLDDALALAHAAAPASHSICAAGDLAEPADCARIVAEVLSAFGRIDVLVNNAGVRTNSPGAPFWEMSVNDWLRMAHTNCDSVFLLSRAVAPGMIKQGFGKIINVSTNGRTMVREKFSPYGPSKAFVEACTRIWARELAGTGVTANVLLPGGNVDTSADVTGAPASGASTLPASIMIPPLLWLTADESNGHSGERFVANLWNESVDLPARIAAARQSGGGDASIM